MPRASNTFMATASIVLAGAAAIGCHQEHYEDVRPPSNQVNGGGGLQGFDVISASDRMAADLLALPALNADQSQWTIVVGRMEDETSDRGFGPNYDIFLSRLKVNLSRQSHGRVTLIENKGRFHQLRNEELENGGNDPFGQTSGNTPAPASIQPDFELHGVARDLPNRSHNYYLLEFDVTNLHNRTIPWTNQYEVTISR